MKQILVDPKILFSLALSLLIMAFVVLRLWEHVFKGMEKIKE